MDSLVQLAKFAIESHVRMGQVVVPDSMQIDSPNAKAGTFVTIRTLNCDLRGCIGTIFPTCETLAEEIVRNAIAACSRDGRFSPVPESELDNLDIKVDVLSEPET